MAFGGFEQRGTQQPMVEINTTPLVDVMLVLLVIFIITAPLLTHSIRLDLPEAAGKANSESPGTVTISIPASGVVHWNNEALPDKTALMARLREAAATQPPPAVHLRADRETRYQTIAEVMSAAQEAGIRTLGFITDPNPPNATQPPGRTAR